MGIAAGLVILPHQLVGAVVDIAGGIGAVADRLDVAVLIVGVGIGLVVAGRVNGMTGDLGAGGAVRGACKGEAVGLDYMAKETTCCVFSNIELEKQFL